YVPDIVFFRTDNEIPSQYYLVMPFHFDIDQVRAFQLSAKNRGISLYQFLFSSFAIAIAQVASQQQFILGTTTAGRYKPELECLIGYFVNVIPVKFDIHLDDSLDALFKCSQASVQ